MVTTTTMMTRNVICGSRIEALGPRKAHLHDKLKTSLYSYDIYRFQKQKWTLTGSDERVAGNCGIISGSSTMIWMF